MNDQPSEPVTGVDQPVMSKRDARRARRRYSNDDPINRVTFAGLLVMAGVILLADQIHILPVYNGAGVWSWMALGAGAVFLLSELARSVSGEMGRPNGWSLFAGVALMGFGASAVFGMNWDTLWPVGLILVGFVLLMRNVFGR